MRRSKTSRVIALVLALALVVTTAFSTNVTTANAASGKAIKSVTLKINKKKVNNKTYKLAKGKSATVKVTVKPSSAKKSVTYKSSKKSVATVSKKGKITAKAAGSATITATVKGKNGKKKSAKFTVKVTDGSSSSNTTAVQETTTTETATTAAPATTTEAPATPKQSYTVKTISAINPSTGEVVLTFDKTVSADELKGTTITITSEDGTKVNATFKEISAEGKDATYVIAEDDLSKIETGNYTITTDIAGVTIPEDIAATSAKVQITGSSVKGLVYYQTPTNEIVAVKRASVTIGGKTVKSDDNGYYETAVSAATYPLITVKADGYFDANKETIKVVSNKASAYNFAMEPYNIDEVYLYGTVTNKADSSSVVADATVTLYEDDEVKATVTTDAKGRFAFLNPSAELPTTFAVGSGAKTTFSVSDEISKEHTYKIVVNKGIETDLFDAWKEAESGTIELGSAKNVKVDLSMTKVAALGEITLSLNWATEATKKADSTNVSVSLMDTDGERVIQSGKIDLTGYLNDTNSEMSQVYKLVDKNFFGKGANAHPTLPSGTYYLVIKDLADSTTQQNATAVAEVKVTEGGSVAITSTIKKAVSRTISYTVGLSDAYKDRALKNQTTFTTTSVKKTLKNVTDNDGTLGSDIAINTGVYQMVGQTPVLIDTISGTNLTASKPEEGSEPAFTASKTASNLASDTKYQLVTQKSYLESATKSFSTAEETTWSVSFKGAANVVNVKVSNMDRFVDTQQTNGTAKDETVTVNAVTVTPAGGTPITVPVGKQYKLSALVKTGVSIDDEALKGITPGKYTVTFDIEGFALSNAATEQDDAEDIIDLEAASMVSNAKYNKVYPTTVKGVIAYNSSVDETETTNLSANGIAILYSSDMKKILAADTWKSTDGQITYSLEDGIDGTFGAGKYAVLIRGEGIDNQVLEVTVSSENEVVSNANFTDLSVGGNSNISSSITTAQNAALSGNPSVVAQDQYYIDPWSEDVDVRAFSTLLDSDYNGSYTLALAENSTTTWCLDKISKGTYTVIVNSDLTKTLKETIAVNGTYDSPLQVELQSYEDLVRIQLYLTNTNDTFAKGQVDYVVATSADGSVSKDGVFIRSSKTSDSGYFYVPRNQLYTISVYSNDTVVKVEERAAQTAENEKIYLTCQTIE